MKTVIALLAASAAISMGGVPKKVSPDRYRSLWDPAVKPSIFTSPPAPIAPAPLPNPMKDLALLGVSSLGNDHYRVTLVNKNTPDAGRIYIDSEDQQSQYQVVGVSRSEGNPMSTVVTLRMGQSVGTVGYDEKLLAIATPKKAETKADPRAAKEGPNIPHPRIGTPSIQSKNPAIHPRPTP